MMQLDLFGNPMKPTKKEIYHSAATPRETSNQKKEEDSKYTTEYCFEVIANASDLWDMRCWDKYHDHDEVMAWLKSGVANDCKNTGHVGWCIQRLIGFGVPLEKIADAILSNDTITFKNRLVKCWYDPMQCPKFRKQGDYSGSICNECGGVDKDVRNIRKTSKIKAGKSGRKKP